MKKTDWLNNKIMVDTLTSMVALLEKNKLMARAALANTMGLSWDKSVDPENAKIPFSPFEIDTGEIVDKAHQCIG